MHMLEKHINIHFELPYHNSHRIRMYAENGTKAGMNLGVPQANHHSVKHCADDSTSWPVNKQKHMACEWREENLLSDILSL